MPVDAGVTRMLDRQIAGLDEFMHREASHYGDVAVTRIAELTPVAKRIDPRDGTELGESGHLKRSWRKVPVTVEAETYISGASNDVDYAGYVNDGTREHIIPKGGASAGIILHFFTHGKEMFRREVHHPGTRGVFMMQRGLNAVDRDFEETAGQRLQAFLDGTEGE